MSKKNDYKVDWQKEDLLEIKMWEGEIERYHKRYLVCMVEKKYKLADQVKRIISGYKTLLEKLRGDYVRNYKDRINVLPTSTPGSGKVFTVKK